MAELAPYSKSLGLDLSGHLSLCLEGLVALSPDSDPLRSLPQHFLSFDLR